MKSTAYQAPYQGYYIVPPGDTLCNVSVIRQVIRIAKLAIINILSVSSAYHFLAYHP